MKEYIVQAIEQETIDAFDAHNAPELIRCKDCKHYNIIGCAGGFGWCERYGMGCTDDFFCADGERKE